MARDDMYITTKTSVGTALKKNGLPSILQGAKVVRNLVSYVTKLTNA